MKTLLIPGVLGLLLGLTLHWTQLSQPWRWMRVAFLSGVTTLGWTLLGVVALTWLAVLPPEAPERYAWVLLRGGILFVLSAWACGFSPVTALSGLSLRPVEALCMLIGCGVGSLLQGEVASMHASAEAVLADLPMLPVWLGAICVVTGMIGVLVGWRRLQV